MQISEAPKTKYYVQFYCMSDKKWLTINKFIYYVDAVVDLGLQISANPSEDHRILRVMSETAIEVPSIDSEKME